MDMLSIAGIGLAISALALGQTMEGGQLGSLLNGSALVIVFGGTLAASLLQTSPSVFRQALKRAKWALLPPPSELQPTLDKIVLWSATARQDGYLGLENLVDQEPDPFCAKALQLLIDGAEPDDLRHILELELGVGEDLDFQAVRLFESMGGYAPTLGILGAVLGLIQVLENLADPQYLGGGIAAAFVATVYGVGAANLLFLPLANKLKGVINHQSRHGELVIEGVVAIAHGEQTRTIQAKLRGFLRYA